MCVGLTRYTWYLQGIHGIYKVYMELTRYTLDLQGIHGIYKVYMGLARCTWDLQVIHRICTFLPRILAFGG